MPQPPQHISPSSTLSMDLPFSLRELDHALGSMHPRKAPGDDGVTTALMQAIAHDPKDHGTGDVNLDRPASNLRGISLINVGLKILCKMVQARLSSLLESNNVLVPEQDGFRTREESTAQVCALTDILRRRQIADLNSHIAFIDISKAFGLSQKHHPRGLMFADDIAIIAPSHESLCTSMGTIADWAARWEMSLGFPSVYEYLGVIIDDLLTLSPWLVKKKRAITAAAHSISPLLWNNFLSTRYRLTIFNGLVLGVAYYGLELIGGNSTLARRLQAPVNTGIRMILKAPLFTPIAPMLTDCGIISLDAHAILARVRLTVKATTLKTPLRTLLLPSTIPSHSNSWFWTRRSRSLIRFVHPNMSLFHFNIPISTNGLFHNPISTNSSITSSNINRSIQRTLSINTSNTTTSTTIPSTPTIAEIRHQRSKYALERTFQVWGKSKLACSYVQANHASSANFLRSPALSTGQAIGASLLSLARCGGLWDYPRALNADLLHPTATDPDQLGSPSLCILCHSHLDCKPMAHLVVDCTHPTVFFARVDTQLLQAINDTRVQIFDCTLHTAHHHHYHHHYHTS
ncbi:hypothetical protein BASA83_008737 [Batrachochytrium salamandrivorans]|nr:hypothetical protein BASA83_008737 [Batrachochytrium salamandrivorans]